MFHSPKPETIARRADQHKRDMADRDADLTRRMKEKAERDPNPEVRAFWADALRETARS